MAGSRTGDQKKVRQESIWAAEKVGPPTDTEVRKSITAAMTRTDPPLKRKTKGEIERIIKHFHVSADYWTDESFPIVGEGIRDQARLLEYIMGYPQTKGTKWRDEVLLGGDK